MTETAFSLVDPNLCESWIDRVVCKAGSRWLSVRASKQDMDSWSPARNPSIIIIFLASAGN